MSRKRQRRRWIVRRKYETSRLSPIVLERAYTKIIPGYIQVVCIPAGEAEELCEACQQPQDGVAR